MLNFELLWVPCSKTYSVPQSWKLIFLFAIFNPEVFLIKKLQCSLSLYLPVKEIFDLVISRWCSICFHNLSTCQDDLKVLEQFEYRMSIQNLILNLLFARSIPPSIYQKRLRLKTQKKFLSRTSLSFILRTLGHTESHEVLLKIRKFGKKNTMLHRSTPLFPNFFS